MACTTSSSSNASPLARALAARRPAKRQSGPVTTVCCLPSANTMHAEAFSGSQGPPMKWVTSPTFSRELSSLPCPLMPAALMALPNSIRRSMLSKGGRLPNARVELAGAVRSKRGRVRLTARMPSSPQSSASSGRNARFAGSSTARRAVRLSSGLAPSCRPLSGPCGCKRKRRPRRLKVCASVSSCSMKRSTSSASVNLK
mmetsp:Transcript_90028/g.233489  ORF Transcript_90028/g.233489 Transcript_90028/m.233489 type:complete len:200 (-) Transcript_90028:765-1364(-)